MPKIDQTKPHATIDTEADAAYIYLKGKIRAGGVARTIKAGPVINLDLDKFGRLVGVELLSLKLLHPSVGPVLDITSRRRRKREMAL